MKDKNRERLREWESHKEIRERYNEKKRKAGRESEREGTEKRRERGI